MKYNKTSAQLGSAQLSSADPLAAFLFGHFGGTGSVVGRGRGEDASLRGAEATAATAGRAGRPGRPGGEEAGPGWLVALEDTPWWLTVQQTLLLALEVVPVSPTAAVLEGGAGAATDVVGPPLYAAPALTRVGSLTAVRLAGAGHRVQVHVLLVNLGQSHHGVLVVVVVGPAGLHPAVVLLGEASVVADPVWYEGNPVDPGPDLVSSPAAHTARAPGCPVRHRALHILRLPSSLHIRPRAPLTSLASLTSLSSLASLMMVGGDLGLMSPLLVCWC